MKITKRELMQIINEEVQAYRKAKNLEVRRNEIIRQLNEMAQGGVSEAKVCSECGRPMENMGEGIGKFITKAVEKAKEAAGVMSPEEKSKIMDELIAKRYKGIIDRISKDSGKDVASLGKELKDFVIKSKLPIQKDQYGNYAVYSANNPANFSYGEKGWETGAKSASITSHMLREKKKK